MNTFLLIFNALPAILQSVQAVESAIPMSQSGQHKMNLILGAAEAAWELGQAGQHLSKSNTVHAVQSLATLAVSSLNAAGVFKRSASVAPSSTTTAPVLSK
jgi:hypothetical protein